MSVLATKPTQLQDKIKKAPKLPGCYMYKDQNGKIIYVGKAKNIINRVKSYFINYPKLDLKIQAMIDNAVDIDFLTVDSEVEALILETNLIKKYHPKYNTMMMDDKNYSYVMFEKQIKGINDFPRIRLVRAKEDPDAEYFGPYPNRMPLKNILKRLRKVFPYASCNRRLVQVSKDPLKIDTNNSSPCLYYHLGLCKAPCASYQSKEDYMKTYNQLKKFFRGEKVEILKELEVEMGSYAKAMDYENAAQVRDKINDIKYVTKYIKVDNDVDDISINELQAQSREEGINQLIEELKFPQEKLQNHKGFKIECYDISNIQGTNAVGAMTVMVDGELRKDLYRKFKIQRKNTPNDFAMMQEVLRRRLSYLIQPPELTSEIEASEDAENISEDPSQISQKAESSDNSFDIMPDLIIVDGGKGQLSAAYTILYQMGLHNTIPIVGLAKREEEIFKLAHQFFDNSLGNYIPELEKTFTRIFLTRRSEALFIVQRIRDEAHRFGITYHRKLRSKKMLVK